MHLSSSTITGDNVHNAQGEDLGKIEDLMIDTATGEVTYAVLSFGGFLGIGDKLFAVPLQALRPDPDNHAFILDVPKERLKSAPGFDKDNWPSANDPEWTQKVYSYYL